MIRHLEDSLKVLQDQLRDPLLTMLTILLALMIFVIAPLHAAGFVSHRVTALRRLWCSSVQC
jgi:hypothetical protein